MPPIHRVPLILLSSHLSGCVAAMNIVELRTNLGADVSVCPGGGVTLQVCATLKNGKQRCTNSGIAGLPWTVLRFRYLADVTKGGLYLPADPAESWKQAINFEVMVHKNESVRAGSTVRPRYDCNYSSDFSGARGSSGYSGDDGSDGSDGDDATTDSNGYYTGDGGAGGDGADGGNGQDGADGQDGGTVIVWVDTMPGEPYCLVIAQSGGSTARFVVDPTRATVLVNAAGGKGGDGGHGGDGGDGGDGGSGGNQGSGGDAGDGGDGGDGGRGGRGGSAQAFIDPSAWSFSSHLTFDTSGGAGGPGGSAGSAGTAGYPGGTYGTSGTGGTPGSGGRAGPRGTVTKAPQDLHL